MSGIVSIRAARRTALVMAALGLAGCTQMTKHSNTLVFGTTTTVGVKVGQDANQTPTIEIGYGRQEAAFVPVLANTGVGPNGDLTPCSSDIPECKYVASHDGEDKDSYSTLASFGGEAGADMDGTTGKAGGKVAIAQYFATGIAAQYLAITGGANVVQAGGDTKAKAEAAQAAAGLVVSSRQVTALAEQAKTSLEAGTAKIEAILTTDDVTQANVTALNTLFGTAPVCRTVGNIDSYVGTGKKASLMAYLTDDRAACVRALGAKDTEGAAS